MPTDQDKSMSLGAKAAVVTESGEREAGAVTESGERTRDCKTWKVSASTFATKCFNPIRDVVENLKITPNPDKPMIALSIGDPTVFGNLRPPKEVTEAVIEAIRSGKHNGYAPSTGHTNVKEAVAKYVSTPTSSVEAKDVILCSGCSSALDISITALCSPGQNILVSKPGFPLYQTLAEGLGISVKYYNILPDRHWEVDLGSLEGAIDASSAAIVLTNPSNPCGSVFSKGHLEDILEVARRHKLPIIADEIYENFVFEGEQFHWVASLTTEVPVLSCGGTTKRFLIPGWRMGWIVVFDRNEVLDKQIRDALHRLSQRVIGSNTIVQAAVPAILNDTPKQFFADTIRVVQENAFLSHRMLSSAPGLHPVMPQGAMYMMVRIEMERFPQFATCLEFIEQIISEESVFCLPGKCFNAPNFFRVVLTVPAEQLTEACQRIQRFCSRHYVTDPAQNTSETHDSCPEKAAINQILNPAQNTPETHDSCPEKAAINQILNGNHQKQCCARSANGVRHDTRVNGNGSVAEPGDDITKSKASAILERERVTADLDAE